MNNDAFFIPDTENDGERIFLSKGISAIQLVQKENGRAKLGLLAQLGPGTTVQRCGKGFNERTVKVRVQGEFYFVFRHDLDGNTTAGSVQFAK